MFDGVVLVLGPSGELPVEDVKRREVELFGEKLIADAPKEPLDFSFGGGIADGGVAENAADASADEGEFLAGVDGSIIDVKLLRDAALVKSGPDGLDHGVDILFEEEFAVAEHAAGVVNERDQPCLPERTAFFAGNGRAEQGVGLPELVGVMHAEGEAPSVFFGLGLQQIVLAHETEKSRLCDPAFLEQALLDAEAVDGHLVDTLLLMEVRQCRIDGLQQFLRGDLSGQALVPAGLACHAGDAVIFVAVVPGLYGAPGERTEVALVVGKGHFGDLANALVPCFTFRRVNGAQHPHFQVRRGVFHGGLLPGISAPDKRGRFHGRRL